MTRRDKLAAVGFSGVVAAAIAIPLASGWWAASIQADVYRRQGVDLSTWEVFMGAKPVERVIVAPNKNKE